MIFFIYFIIIKTQNGNSEDLKKITDSGFDDYCSPLSINGSDYILAEKQYLKKNSNKLCDEGCEFISLDYHKNYSACKCKMNEEENINSEVEEFITTFDIIETIKSIIDVGSWKYFLCFKIIYEQRKAIFNNYLIYVTIPITLFIIILFIIFFILYYKEIEEVYVGILENINLNNNFQNIAMIGNNNDNEIRENYFEARQEGFNFFNIWWRYLKQKLVILGWLDINIIENKLFKIIKFIIVIVNYIFNTIYLFNDYFIVRLKEKDINKKYIQVPFNIMLGKSIFIIAVCYVINSIIFFFFDGIKSLRRVNEIWILDLENYRKKIIYLQKVIKLKLIIGFIIVLFLNIACVYYSFIFGLLFPNTQLMIIVCLIFTLIINIFGSALILLFATFLRWISLKCDCQIFEYIFDLSIIIAGLV